MTDLEDLQSLIESWGVRYFTARELCVEPRTGIVTVPPRDLWLNVRPALLAADCVRHALGIPIKVVSGYRSPEYNAATDGASPRSEHMFFRALDLRPSNASVTDLEKMRFALWLLVMRDRQDVGCSQDLRILHYDTFCHIDAAAMPDKPRTGPKLDFRS